MKRSFATVSLATALILSSAAMVQAAPAAPVEPAITQALTGPDSQSGKSSIGVHQLLSAIDQSELIGSNDQIEPEQAGTGPDEFPMSGAEPDPMEAPVADPAESVELAQSEVEGPVSTPVGRATNPQIGDYSCQVPSDVVLDQHWGPVPNQPYQGLYRGTNRSKNIVIDPNKLYATSTTVRNHDSRPVTELSPSDATGTFRSTPAAIGNMTGPNYWSASSSDLTTMAIDGGANGARVGKSYLWSWAEASLTGSPALVSSLPPIGTARSNSISIAEVLNNSDGALTNNVHPNRIFFVPKPTSSSYRYWSGGEVDQRTGYLYLTSGEDSTLGNTFRMMIFDPATGNYAESGVMQPKTPADHSLFNGRFPASDMAIDGRGDAYVLVADVPTPNPGTGVSQQTTWLVKVEYRLGGGWIYSGVMPLWGKTGSTYQRIYGTNTWGMAFYEGKLYLSGVNQPGVGGGQAYTFAADPLTGLTTMVPGSAGASIYDLASAQMAAVLNGTVYRDLNRNGAQDASEPPLADQTIQLYTADGTVVGQQTTNMSGEYSFLVPPPSSDTTYYVRLVQPQVTVGATAVNAVQTGITFSTLCGIDRVQVQSYGQNLAPSTAPSRSGSYIDYPKQTLGATNGSQILTPSQMVLAAQYQVQAGSDDVTTVNFGVSVEGSWGDAGFRSTIAQDGPRHLNAVNAGDEPMVYLGENPGWYTDGATNNSHSATDDGVKAAWRGDGDPGDPETWVMFDPEQRVYALGTNYSFYATVQGERAANSTVRAWLQNRNTSSFPSTVTARASGGSAELRVMVPSTPALSSSQHYLRVNATSSGNQLDTDPFNNQPGSTGPYAPSKGSAASRASDWVIDGETEDYRLTLANAALHLSARGAPGTYGFTLTNVSSAAPSSTSVTGVIPSDGSLQFFSSHAVNSVSAITNITLSLPAGVRVVGAVELLDVNGNVVGEASYSRNTNQLSIPTSVWSTARDLTLRLTTEVELKVQAVKEVATNDYGTGTSPVIPDHFEIVATDTDGQEVILNGGTPVVLDRDRTYTISERVAPGAPDQANFYLDAGLTCTDGSGGALPAGMFDPEARTITPDKLTPTVKCTWRNQAAEATLLPARVGGTSAGSGWQLQLQAAEAAFDANLTETAANSLIRPGKYDLSVGSVPTGTQVAGVERLNLDDPTCAPLAETLTNIPPDCWLPLSGTGLNGLTLAAGTHEVFRLVAVAGEELPALPLTGGLGAWVFALLGGGGLLVAGTLSGYRKWRMTSAGTSAPQASD